MLSCVLRHDIIAGFLRREQRQTVRVNCLANCDLANWQLTCALRALHRFQVPPHARAPSSTVLGTGTCLMTVGCSLAPERIVYTGG